MNSKATLTLKDIKAKDYGIENNLISFNIKIIGHFDNMVSLMIIGKNILPYYNYNNTANLGFILQYLVNLLDIGKEDGIYLSEIRDIPVRLIFDSSDCSWGSKCIGIGHFMEDKFILFDELSKITMEKYKDE